MRNLRILCKLKGGKKIPAIFTFINIKNMVYFIKIYVNKKLFIGEVYGENKWQNNIQWYRYGDIKNFI